MRPSHDHLGSKRALAAATFTLLLASGCTVPVRDFQNPGHPVRVEPAPEVCEPTMDWKPRAFPGPAFYVDAAATPPGSGTAESPWTNLQHAIDEAPNGAILVVRPGTYSAGTTDYTDPSCGNCAPEDQHAVPATRGFLISGKSLALYGGGEGKTILQTNAGYGFLVEDACEVYASDLTVTGGVRDPDGAAADGAIVVRRARLTLQGVGVRNNTGLLPDNGFPGIAGLMLRQGADVLVMRSVIDNNSWDGVTVFDDGKLRMYGSRVSRGNGVGVGVTWSGRALLVNNEITGYWKGIGSFVDAQVEARNNTVHHHVGWGVWVTQRARLDLYNNTIAYNDLIGVSLDGAEVTGTFVNNAVAFNGRHTMKRYAENTFGTRSGVRGAAPTEATVFAPAYNVVWGNQLYDWLESDGVTAVDSSGMGSNQVADPHFAGEYDLRPGPLSALLDAGDPTLLDPNGSRSDVGATGGPWAGKTEP